MRCQYGCRDGALVCDVGIWLYKVGRYLGVALTPPLDPKTEQIYEQLRHMFLVVGHAYLEHIGELEEG
jgi:hypothetical protein